MKRLIPLLLAACSLPLPLALCAQPVRQVAPPPQDLATLGDEFRDPTSLDQWTRFDRAGGWPDRFQRLEVDPTGDGSLWIEPGTSGWYADFHGALLSKRVNGDFDVTVRLKTSGKADAVPTRAWSLAGLMVRQPRAVTPADWVPGQENWLFLTTGTGDRAGVPMIESKTTVNSRSNLKLRPTAPGWVELRIIRLRDAFILLRRPEGEQRWVVHERFHRRDLPFTLEVGLAAYTDWDSAEAYWNDPAAFNTAAFADGTPDLRVQVDYIRFAPPPRLSGTLPDALTDYSLGNEALLEQLGL